jgi:hypothetical protein
MKGQQVTRHMGLESVVLAPVAWSRISGGWGRGSDRVKRVC